MILIMRSIPFSSSSTEMQSILVVDDDIAACMVIQRMVRLLGYECVMVHDGEDALRAASYKNYVVILMDSFMPAKNGWNAALEVKLLKKIELETTLPCKVAMLSLDDTLSRLRLMASGARWCPFQTREQGTTSRNNFPFIATKDIRRTPKQFERRR